MEQFKDLWKSFDLRHIGLCSICMRMSFKAALFAAVFWLATLALLAPAAIQLITGLLTAVLACLWLAHVARRAHLKLIEQDQPDMHRRYALGRVLAVLAGAISVSVAFPRPAHALSGCGGWAGNSGCSRCADGSYVTACERQDEQCRCYFCRSCGNRCGNNVC